MTLPAYDPKNLEPNIAKIWEQHQIGRPSKSGENYCIMVPPPNITGSLHLGHALQLSILDTLVRHQRYMGKNVLLQVGTDHAGIATQMVVERNLSKKGIQKSTLSRDEFLDHIWDWIKESGGTITQQMRHIGVSVDWEHERFTLDPDFSKAVSKTFIKLYEEDLIYKGKKMVNWDTKLKTAVSDLEVINEKRSGQIWYINYPLEKGGSLTVATTRPETLFGDQAVCVHPEDERYKHLVGKMVKLPLCERLIPIIADDYVDPEFGTGCVKITPAHDFNDHDIGQRHNLEMLNIMNDDATMNAECPEAYQGLDRFEARKKAVKALEALSLIEKIEPYQVSAPIGDRSMTILEPRLTDQWFMNMKNMAEEALSANQDGRLNFVPDVWDKTYENWLTNIQDWCISRQLVWGHRIPAWYDEDHQVYVGESEQAIREKFQISGKLTQDTDVLDTWFSSALWPFATLGWPEQTDRLATFYPNQLLVTGFDIIFFWVARMVMMGMQLTDQVPFKSVFVTGLIRDEKGQKMSKSKGNVLDPLDLIHGISLEYLSEKRTSYLMQPAMQEKILKDTQKLFPNGIEAHGTDALRFTLLHLCTHGRDIKFDLNRLKASRNFCNKIWNAARLLEQSNYTDQHASSDMIIATLEQQLQQLSQMTQKHLQDHRLDLYASELYEFFWHQFCDWYLECLKALKCTKLHQALEQAFDKMLVLYHPALPFITEGIWQNRHQKNESLALQPYPEFTTVDTSHTHTFDEIKDVISNIRRIRSELNIPPAKQLKLYTVQDQLQILDQHETLVCKIAGIEAISKQAPSTTACAFISQHTQAAIELDGLVNPNDEIIRLNKKRAKQENELNKLQRKVSQPHYQEKAPKTLQERDSQEISRIKSQIQLTDTYLQLLHKM